MTNNPKTNTHTHTERQGHCVPHIHISSLLQLRWMVGHTQRASQKYCSGHLRVCAFICALMHVCWSELWPALAIKATRESTFMASLLPFSIFPFLPLSVSWHFPVLSNSDGGVLAGETKKS